MRTVAVGVLVAAVGLGAYAGFAAPPGSAASPGLQTIASPAGAGSAQPQLTASSRGVLLSWIERTGTHAALKFAERTPGGWSEVRQVASGDNWFVNWADVPSVLRLSDGTIYGHWLQKSGPGTYAYDVRLARSTDEGRTFSASFTPHHDGTETEHGFASLFEMPTANLGLVWLDGRGMKGDGHGGPDAGAMSLRAARFDREGRQVSETAIDLRVCECCPTAAVATPDGPITAYRDRSDGEIRDIFFSRLVGGQWTPPAAVHDDGWKIAACPVNGPALSADGRRVVIAWFTARGDEGHAYAAFSTDAGASFGAPIRLDEASALGRVDVEALPDGAALATWIEFAGGRAQFMARRVKADGTKGAPFPIAGMAATRASGYPRMARHGDEIVFAWTEAGDAPGVRTAVLVPDP